MFIYQDLKRIDYAEALAIQTAAFDELLALKERGETGTSRLFFCEHNPVLTLGKHGLDTNLLVSEDVLRRRGVAFYHTNRGGDITYHGPGQITGYPVFDLEPLHLGLRAYIEALEETVIRFLARFDLHAERMAGATGSPWVSQPALRSTRKPFIVLYRQKMSLIVRAMTWWMPGMPLAEGGPS